MDARSWMIYVGNALRRLEELPDESVHVAVTSPPYWGGLRDYNGESEQLGHEPHPRLYAIDLADICDVLRRKLRPEGTLWLNLGDAYVGSGGAGGDYNEGGLKEGQDRFPGSRRTSSGFSWPSLASLVPNEHGTIEWVREKLIAAGWSPPAELKDKDLGGAPWEVARELRARGWWLRCDVIWHKTNVKPGGGHLDRPTIDHEYVFQLTKSQRSYYDSFAVKVPAKKEGTTRNRRSVWVTPVSGYKGMHFATFNPLLVEPMILASTSEVGVCAECGAPWKRLEERLTPSTFTEMKELYGWNTKTLQRRALIESKGEDKNAMTSSGTTPHLKVKQSYTAGWTRTCQCYAGAPIPAIVLDPFAGAASAGLAALKLGRSFVGVELSAAYAETCSMRLRGEYPDVHGIVVNPCQEIS